MNGPLGLPIAASSHAGEVDHTIVLVHILMAVLFVGWGAFFLYTLWRFRRSSHPVADYTGVTSHLHQRVWQHKHHVANGFTRQQNCTGLVYIAEFERMDDAIAWAKALKGK